MLNRIFLLATLILCCVSHSAQSADNYRIETITQGLNSPWAMAFLPNEDILVTERGGKLRIVREGKVLDAEVNGVPSVYFAGQGGLLDIMLDARFESNQIVYLSFSHGTRNANATRLVSAKLNQTSDGYELANLKELFTAQPAKRTAHHYGARIAQLKDGTLLMTVGDGFDYREQAQKLDSHLGKIVRINRDGSVPINNPFVTNDAALPEIFSYGHRNQQSLLVDGDTIIEHEHGPRGGDEVNIISAGNNYGWPVATYGIDYNGARISPFTSYQGMQSPLVNWTPSIAPSSMTLHKGKLYVTSLAEGSVRKLEINGDTISDDGIVFEKLSGRLRDIVSGPDGHLYVLTDGGDARIVKIFEQ